jgi:hypothetical protein
VENVKSQGINAVGLMQLVYYVSAMNAKVSRSVSLMLLQKDARKMDVPRNVLKIFLMLLEYQSVNAFRFYQIIQYSLKQLKQLLREAI